MAARVWRNWSGLQRAQPAQWLQPPTEAELCRALPNAIAPIRVTGASHSFAPLCVTEGALVQLDALAGLRGIDPETGIATVGAGTRLRDLGAPLWAAGRSLINQGDVDPQAVGGACGTSTHGTGITLGSFSSFVERVRLVSVDGTVHLADRRQNPDLLHAAQTSLGVLGVITEVGLRTLPAYHLHEQERVMSTDALLAALPAAMRAHRHCEAFIFPKAGRGILKTLDVCPPGESPRRIPLPVDAVLSLCSTLAHGLPGVDTAMQRCLLALHSNPDRRGPAWRIFPSDRNCRFNEMEYELPIARGLETLAQVVETLARSPIRQLFPVEFRTVAADEAWLSPFYQRDAASISVHQFHRVDPWPLFDTVEPLLVAAEGRPHWGKLHRLTAAELKPRYPRWEDFLTLRARLDPEGRLLNADLRRWLGL
jgi:FAD-linked oxidoreductase